MFVSGFNCLKSTIENTILDAENQSWNTPAGKKRLYFRQNLHYFTK